MLGLVNLRVGNLLSIQNAFAKIGLACRNIDDPGELGDVDGVILPGVGAFHVAMETLQARGFIAPLRALAESGDMPILGICLGMQLLADESAEHGVHKGLGLVPGRVTRLVEQEINGKVPNVGWCGTRIVKSSRFFPESAGERSFYYVHSYHFSPESKDAVVAVAPLGAKEVVAAVELGSVSGIQFHPEKSQDDGIDLLANWALRSGLRPAVQNS